MSKDELNKFYYDIFAKGVEIGLTKSDYIEIKRKQQSMDPEKVATDSNWYELYEKFNNLIHQFYHSGILHKYSMEICEYIMDNSFLLPLVLANNSSPTIKMYGENSYRFLCQFHHEKTPSMGVSDYQNLLYCFGCGIGLNVISYLEVYENLTFKEVIELLSQIYLFDLKTNDSLTKYQDLVNKYQDSILSKEYVELLEMGYERLKSRHGTTVDKKIDGIYNARFETIERVRNKVYDPNFQYNESKNKLLYLSK